MTAAARRTYGHARPEGSDRSTEEIAAAAAASTVMSVPLSLPALVDVRATSVRRKIGSRELLRQFTPANV